MQKVEGSNPFSRFPVNRRLSGAGFLLTAPFLSHQLGHSQEELGFRADVHRTQISLIESGQRFPKIGTALKLAAALEVELSTLLRHHLPAAILLRGPRRVRDPRGH